MTIHKDFFLGKEWDEGTADAIDSFCEDVVADQVERRSGSYTGTGASNVVKFAPALSTPAILWLEDPDGAVVTVMSPRATGHVTAWSKQNLTLRAGSTYNQAGKTYRFFLISS